MGAYNVSGTIILQNVAYTSVSKKWHSYTEKYVTFTMTVQL